MTKGSAIPRRDRPLIVGEVLYDVFPGGVERLGGAPFNVAWHLRGLGLDPYFVSAAGEDAREEGIGRRMEDWGLDRSGIRILPGRDTGVAQVTFNEKGEPRYDLKPAAWDYLRIPEEIWTGPVFSILYHGSLAWRGSVSRGSFLSLRERWGGPVFVDVNIRERSFDPAWLPHLLRGAHWVKVSREELASISGRPCAGETEIRTAAGQLQTQYGCGAVWITGGERGSWWLGKDGDQFLRAAAQKVGAVVDTVGAGDAFCAMAICGLLRGWGPQEILEWANRLAAAVCMIPGATCSDPRFYDSFRQLEGG